MVRDRQSPGPPPTAMPAKLLAATLGAIVPATFAFLVVAIACAAMPSYGTQLGITALVAVYAVAFMLALMARRVATIWRWMLLISASLAFILPLATFWSARAGLVASGKWIPAVGRLSIGAMLAAGLVTVILGFIVGPFVGLILLVVGLRLKGDKAVSLCTTRTPLPALGLFGHNTSLPWRSLQRWQQTSTSLPILSYKKTPPDGGAWNSWQLTGTQRLGVTSTACKPLGPCLTSKVTRCPSVKVLKPVPVMAE